MACGTVVGSPLEFGIAVDEASLQTTSVRVTKRADKAEARDKCGIVTSVAYYNKTEEIEIEGFGNSALAVAAALTLAGSFNSGTGLIYIDEVAVEKTNENYVTSTIRATRYSGITS